MVDLISKLRRALGSGGVASDSVMLIGVKVVTSMVRIVQTMILARFLTKQEYGTYSQGLLVIALFAPILSLGMDSAVNFFYNNERNRNEKKRWVDTIIAICMAAGVIGAVGIYIFRDGIAGYYRNPDISPLMIYIAIRPCLQNLINVFQNLYISSGHAPQIAIRNLAVSVSQVGVIGVAALVTTDLALLFALLALLDFAQLVVFSRWYGKHDFRISFITIDGKKVRRIFLYALPLLLASSVGTLSSNLGRLVTSGLMSTEDFALYSVVSQELPYSFILSSMTTVVTPMVTFLLARKEKERFVRLWSDYMEFGYVVTIPLCIMVFAAAPDVVEILYSTQYATPLGTAVFRVYTVLAMIRFTYFGLVPTAMGETKVVTLYSVIALLINIPLTVVLFGAFGMLGASLATLGAVILTSGFYLRKSLRLVDVKLPAIFDVCRYVRITLLFIVAAIAEALGIYVAQILGFGPVARCIVGFIIFAAVSAKCVVTRFKSLFASLNTVRLGD